MEAFPGTAGTPPSSNIPLSIETDLDADDHEASHLVGAGINVDPVPDGVSIQRDMYFNGFLTSNITKL